MQHGLRRALLGGAVQRVALQVRQFAFEGELAQRGELRQLAARMPQAPLAPATLRAAVGELDTAAQLTALRAVLEDVVRTLAGFGFANGANAAATLPPATVVTPRCEGRHALYTTARRL